MAGRPAEYFDIHTHNEKYWLDQLSINSEADYPNKVVDAGTTSNGVFDFKLHWHQAPALREKLLADRQAEVLIPAYALANGSTITYWHVEVDSHDILITNGMPADSYIDIRIEGMGLDSLSRRPPCCALGP